MNILYVSVEKRSVRNPAAVGHAQLGHRNLGRAEQHRAWWEAALLGGVEGEDGAGAKGAVAKIKAAKKNA